MSKPLVGCLVLIVEDEPLIAMDIANALTQAGAQVVFSRTLKEAMEKADLPNLTAAIIDHALHDGVVTSDVCAKLKERDIPFIVYSGYNKLEGACADGELVHKPANPELLVTTLSGVLAQHRRSIN
jgi:DNA-binding response OmpR family regulator